jgi:ABC-type branched-subunit amino acid transport system substrate-binding protein
MWGRYLAGASNVSTISFAASAESVTDMPTAPPFTTFRVCQTDMVTALAVNDAVNHFGWQEVNILYAHDAFGRNLAETMSTLFEDGV